MPLNPTAEDGGGEDKPWTFWKMQTETLVSLDMGNHETPQPDKSSTGHVSLCGDGF